MQGAGGSTKIPRVVSQLGTHGSDPRTQMLSTGLRSGTNRAAVLPAAKRGRSQSVSLPANRQSLINASIDDTMADMPAGSPAPTPNSYTASSAVLSMASTQEVRPTPAPLPELPPLPELRTQLLTSQPPPPTPLVDERSSLLSPVAGRVGRVGGVVADDEEHGSPLLTAPSPPVGIVTPESTVVQRGVSGILGAVYDAKKAADAKRVSSAGGVTSSSNNSNVNRVDPNALDYVPTTAATSAVSTAAASSTAHSGVANDGNIVANITPPVKLSSGTHLVAAIFAAQPSPSPHGGGGAKYNNNREWKGENGNAIQGGPAGISDSDRYVTFDMYRQLQQQMEELLTRFTLLDERATDLSKQLQQSRDESAARQLAKNERQQQRAASPSAHKEGEHAESVNRSRPNSNGVANNAAKPPAAAPAAAPRPPRVSNNDRLQPVVQAPARPPSPPAADRPRSNLPAAAALVNDDNNNSGRRDMEFKGHCWRCKENGHRRVQCPQTKCFNCQQYGHISRQCREPRQPRQPRASRTNPRSQSVRQGSRHANEVVPLLQPQQQQQQQQQQQHQQQRPATAPAEPVIVAANESIAVRTSGFIHPERANHVANEWRSTSYPSYPYALQGWPPQPWYHNQGWSPSSSFAPYAHPYAIPYPQQQ